MWVDKTNRESTKREKTSEMTITSPITPTIIITKKKREYNYIVEYIVKLIFEQEIFLYVVKVQGDKNDCVALDPWITVNCVNVPYIAC